MPTVISNPASLSSVRNAFNAEGYGISTSLFAYRQGGGIVPNLPAFNVIGAGTSGDPLRLSQFNGFSVPSKYLDSKVLTSGSYFYFNYSASGVLAYYVYGFSTPSMAPAGAMGSLSPDINSYLYGGAPILYLGYNTGNNTLALVIQGYQPNSGWTNMNIGGFNYARSIGLYAYVSEENATRWWFDHIGGIPTIDGFQSTITWD